MAEIDYSGVDIAVRMSPVGPGEAAARGLSPEEADAEIRRLMKEAVESRCPGANVSVVTEGDQPVVEIANLDEYRIAQALKYDLQRLALKVKWDFSPGGLGLRSSYAGPLWS
jgi:hypothetical protein